MAFESATTPAQTHSILDAYVRTAPSDQNALDIFKGEWASKLPPPLDHLSAGPHRLFQDGRVAWGLPLLGGVDEFVPAIHFQDFGLQLPHHHAFRSVAPVDDRCSLTRLRAP